MEELNGTTIFWLIALGALVGFITKLILGERGLGMLSNVTGSAIGSVLLGGIIIVIGLPAPLMFAFLGCLALLFLMNVFNVQEDSHEHEAASGVRRAGNGS